MKAMKNLFLTAAVALSAAAASAEEVTLRMLPVPSQRGQET